MYAVFETGGKQYRAVKGKIVRVEKMAYTEGEAIQWKGFAFSDGASATLSAATITAEPVGVFKEPKVIIFKKNRRHNYRRKTGHRQQLLWAKITDIVVG
jgi:large subunit ribosomal protein L21